MAISNYENYPSGGKEMRASTIKLLKLPYICMRKLTLKEDWIPLKNILQTEPLKNRTPKDWKTPQNRNLSPVNTYFN